MIPYLKTLRNEPSDFLSPMLVKELRQGMRGRVFLGSFLLIQVAMIFCAAGGLIAASLTLTEQFQFFSGLFWFIIGVPLVLIIPSLGNKTLRSEMESKSLELVYLTRLTPWRIVAGKWAALFAQSLLFVFAVLPYLVLRYFLGGIDLLNELLVLFSLLLVCAILTAATVGFSSYKGWVIRSVQTVFFIVLFYAIILLFAFPGSPFVSGIGGGWLQNPFVLAAIYSPLLLLLFLEVGTNEIAPPAEPRSLQIRMLGFGFLLVAAILEFAGSSGAALAIASPPLLAIAVFTVTETPRWIKSVYAPYVRRGRIGRLVGRLFLYPGWPSGVLYVVLISVMYGGLFLHADPSRSLSPLMLTVTVILFPVAVTRVLNRSAANGLVWLLAIQVVQLLLAFLGSLLHQSKGPGFESALTVFPTTQALLLAWDALPSSNIESYTAVTGTVLAVSLLILLARKLPLLPLVKQLEEGAALALKKPASDA